MHTLLLHVCLSHHHRHCPSFFSSSYIPSSVSTIKKKSYKKKIFPWLGLVTSPFLLHRLHHHITSSTIFYDYHPITSSSTTTFMLFNNRRNYYLILLYLSFFKSSTTTLMHTHVYHINQYKPSIV